MNDVRRWRAFIAVVVSALLHLAALAVLTLLPRPMATRPPPLRVGILRLPALPVAPAPVPAPHPLSQRAAGGHAASPGHAPSRSPGADQLGPVVTRSPDAPAAPALPGSRLLPKLPWVDSGASAQAEPSHGVTLRNVPGAEPTPEQQRAEEVQRVKGRVDGWMADAFATLRAQQGLVSPWFQEMQEGIEAEMTQGPMPINMHAFKKPMTTVTAMGDEVLEQMGRYGKTGNPLPDRDPDVADVQDRNSYNAQAMIRDPGGQTPAGAIAAALGGMEPLRQTGQRAAQHFGLRAEVEVVVGRDGGVRSARITRPSGNALFDARVTASAQAAARALPLPPKEATGTLAEQIRTLWEVSGEILYDRKVGDVARRDPATAVAETVVGVVTGMDHFDETTGTLTVPDFAQPRIDFKAKLLRLY